VIPLGAEASLTVAFDIDLSVLTYTLLLEVVAQVPRVLRRWRW
jgi:hypothetical protein